MKLFSRLFEHRYCAFCKAPRRIYSKKHIDLTNVLAAGMLSGVVSLAVYGQLDPRALLFFCLVTVFGEVFVFLRWRVSIVCKMCGFDPVLYKRSPSLAASRVREFFTEQVANPRFQLSKSPLLDLQRRIKTAERKLLEREMALSLKRKNSILSSNRSSAASGKGLNGGVRSSTPVVPSKSPVVSPKA